MNSDFTPKIIVFACNWCSYGGADLAGVGRMQYPPSIRLIRLMCSGMVAPSYILRAFERGADGVLVTGCHIGDCHYSEGNHKALKMMAKTRQIIELLGIDQNRLRREWISASEGTRFAQVMTEFTEQVHGLGCIALTKKNSVYKGI
ncbi:MAG: hydrogenase iron-sulfur subunit [Desulfomonilaceae bacterium]|jgi:F420-non-reducing hydrogenase iron-sulfur subunit